MSTTRRSTTIGLSRATKARLNERRAPGQCYDGFLCQLVEMWDKQSRSARAPGRPQKGRGVQR